MITARETLIWLYCGKCGMDWDETMAALREKRYYGTGEDEIKGFVEEFEKAYACLTLFDEEYPATLKNSIRPPLVLIRPR